MSTTTHYISLLLPPTQTIKNPCGYARNLTFEMLLAVPSSTVVS